MNSPKVTDEAHINFLMATPRVCSATEAARVQPDQPVPPADAFTRLLRRLEPDTATLWREAAGQVTRCGGILVVDDSTLDKPYARKIEWVRRHWSGKHHAVVEGRCCINRASPHIWGYEQAKTEVSHSELAGVQRRVGRTWIVDGVV